MFYMKFVCAELVIANYFRILQFLVVHIQIIPQFSQLLVCRQFTTIQPMNKPNQIIPFLLCN